MVECMKLFSDIVGSPSTRTTAKRTSAAAQRPLRMNAHAKGRCASVLTSEPLVNRFPVS